MIKRKGKKTEFFVPRNGSKYIGRYPIVVRSSWERMVCQWLDSNEDVLEWSSENYAIHYYDPIQMKERRYYPDFFARIVDKEGRSTSYIIEVKPLKETRPPIKTRKQSRKTQLTQESTWVTNKAKFEAAERYCKKMGYRFQLLTERELFNK
jgi:hypothetical protein